MIRDKLMDDRTVVHDGQVMDRETDLLTATDLPDREAHSVKGRE